MEGPLTEIPYAELVERLVAATSEANALRLTLRDLGKAEGDSSLYAQVALWRAKAEQEAKRADRLGGRMALAERLVRVFLAQERPDGRDVDAWRQAAKENEEAA